MTAATSLRCVSCGQFVGPDGQWGAVAPSDALGDPDYDLGVDVCSEKCAKKTMRRTGWNHWWSA
jgi:hypothetical protein